MDVLSRFADLPSEDAAFGVGGAFVGRRNDLVPKGGFEICYVDWFGDKRDGFLQRLVETIVVKYCGDCVWKSSL